MTFLLLRRVGILALIGLAGVAVLLAALSSFGRGWEMRGLAAQTHQAVQPLQSRLGAMQSAAEVEWTSRRATAWIASDETSARTALQQEIEAAFQSGVMLNLTSMPAAGARIQFQFHWRGEEAALQRALLHLQSRTPNLNIDAMAMRVVEQNGRNLIELEARASHDWVAP